MSTVVVEVKEPGGSFTAITDDCLFQRTSFTSQFNGAPGSFEVYVRDPDQTYSFATGYEIRCTIDGSNTLGGYVTRVGMTSLADAADVPPDPSDYDMRVWHLTGADYNIAFDRRVFRNTGDYLSFIQINETVDGAILRTAIGNYADMSDFDTSGIDNIATIPDITYVLLQQGWPVRKEFETLLPFSGAVYYIDGSKNVIWKSYDDAEKRWGFSDDPNYDAITVSPDEYQGSLIGFNSVEATEDATMMANDVLVWGGSEFAGAGGTVFHRSTDATSITSHGRWQHAETHFGEQWFKTSAGVTASANAILEGPPGADATGQQKGLKNAQWQFTFTWHSDRVPELSGVRNHIVAGDLVTVNLSTFGVTRLLPVRSITTTFPDAFEADNSHLVQFRATFGLQLSDSFSLWRYVIKNQNRVKIQTQTAVTSTSTSAVFGAQFSGVPTPATDDTTTTFSIPFGYITGTTMVFLDGLLKTPGIDYTESGPSTGEITFTSPPPSTDNLYVIAFTQGAASTPGGGGGSGPEVPAGDLQVFIDSVSTGATGNVPLGTYRESVTIDRAMTLVFAAGTRVFGSSSGGTRVRNKAITITASNVTLDFTAGDIWLSEFLLGSFPNDYIIGVTSGATDPHILGNVANQGGVLDGDHGSYAGVSLPGGTANTGNDAVIDGMTFRNNPGPGVRVYGNEDASAAQRVSVLNNYFYNCSAAAWSNLDPAHPGYLMADLSVLDAGNESGGFKVAKGNNIIVDGNTFDHCNGNALWFDGQIIDGRISNNIVHHAWRAGIMDETSIGTEVYGNKVWECGWEAGQLQIWGAGILESSEKDAYVHDNYVAWCRRAISFVAQARPDNPGTSGNVATGNTVGQTTGTAIGTFGSFDSPVPVISPNTTLSAGNGTWAANGVPANPESGH